MTFTTSSGQYKVYSSQSVDGRTNEANVSALSSPYRVQFPKDVLVGVTVSIGELRFEWALTRDIFWLVCDCSSMYNRYAFASSSFGILVSFKEADFRSVFECSDLLACQARRKRLLFVMICLKCGFSSMCEPTYFLYLSQ